MGIIQYGIEAFGPSRQRALAYLAKRKQKNPGYTVLDVGGASKPWADEYVDAYVDIKSFATTKRVFLGNICEPEIWDEVMAAHGRFDFVICTHVLEDIRDPVFVVRQMRRLARAGFIAMPTKHFEFTNNESRFLTGCSHHRWIYTIQTPGDTTRRRGGTVSAPPGENPHLVAMAKLPVVQCWQSPVSGLLALLCGVPGAGRFVTAACRRLRLLPAVPRLPWLLPSLGRGQLELGFLWEDSFDFKVVNNDYAGRSTAELSSLYVTALDAGM